MASGIDTSGKSNRRRVFVLVDRGEAQGVFCSWDGAEAYADENRIPIDNLLEFQTKPEHPDHFHLMSGFWDNAWRVVGEWTTETPAWNTPPEKIRLQHYHTIGHDFHLLRTKEFPWNEGMLARINPMAPDRALKLDMLLNPAPESPQWKPKLSPLKPVTEDSPSRKPPRVRLEPIEEPPPPEDEPPAPRYPEDEPASQAEPGNGPVVEDQPDTDDPLSPEPLKTAPSHRKPLRLKSQVNQPKPIPVFTPPPVTSSPSTPPRTEAPASEPAPQRPDDITSGLVDEDEEVVIHWKWPLRLYAALFAVVLCWIIGLYKVLKPEPTAHSIVRGIGSLDRAEKVIIEPSHLLFEMRINEERVQYWRHSLELDSIPVGRGYYLPTVDGFLQWEAGETLIQSGEDEKGPTLEGVEEWWSERRRAVSSGYYLTFEDESLILLDINTLVLSGWIRVEHLPGLMP